MSMPSRPTEKPNAPEFSSGPCAKRPGWSSAALDKALTGRSHRAGPAKERLAQSIALQKEILGIPEDYRIGIVAGSDTGAFEMAMWTMLGARGVDVLAWESFGSGWLTDIKKQLKLEDVREFKAGYGQLPDLAQVDCDRDIVFTWNGTTSGVKVPNGDWIAADRKGLTFCDATSAVFAMDLAWDKLDVVTWSWQKVLGGEAAHGMIVLSPRAVARLESYSPAWPLPKIFRLTKGGKVIEGVFKGETINTPSMIAVEDVIDSLTWAQSIGGLEGLKARSEESLKAISDWVAKTDWVDFLAEEDSIRSNTSVCLKIIDPAVTALDEDGQKKVAKDITKLLDKEGVAFDINGYRDAPPGLRLWCGATVEPSDVAKLLPWLDWAFAEVKPS